MFEVILYRCLECNSKGFKMDFTVVSGIVREGVCTDCFEKDIVSIRDLEDAFELLDEISLNHTPGK
jgi:hypothetical protein